MTNNKNFWCALVTISTLYGCGSTPKPARLDTPETNSNSSVVISEAATGINAIERAYAKSQNIASRNLALVQLANVYVSENKCLEAEQVLASINDNSLAPFTQGLSSLLKLECQFTLHKEGIPKPLLTLMHKWSEDTYLIDSGSFQTSVASSIDLDLGQRATLARAKLLAEEKQYSAAIDMLLKQDANKESISTFAYSNALWKWFSLASDASQAQLVSIYPFLQDHLAILQIVEDLSLNDSTRQANIKQWFSQFPDAYITKHQPSQILDYLNLEQSNGVHTAILLPLSGRLSSQGEAIKQGILAAYLQHTQEQQNQDEPSITFLDTGSASELSLDINADTLANYETVIGPLLKSHIEQLAQINLPKQKRIFLNNDENFLNSDGLVRAFYSLSPEQEARQLATLMQSRGIKNPVVIDDSSNVGKRMAKAFNEAWMSELDEANIEVLSKDIETISYTDNKSMRIGITASLDVLQSQRRIQQLSNISNERVYSVTRNRRDLDAFVVFAKPNDLELINPIIEASISLFTEKQIPVFASSYSYDHKQNKNTQRDLRNLVFIDMPLLLPEGRQLAISNTVDGLFNQPPSAFLRLFAFGYDAFTLSENIAQLSTFTHMSVQGLSGKLMVGQNNILIRQLNSLSITDNNG